MLGLGLVAGVVVVVAYLVHFRARWAVERYERQLVAAGETLTVGPLEPPTVFPENNGAPLFNQAMGALSWGKSLLETNPPPSMRMVAPGNAMVGWAQPDVRFDTTNTWDEVDEALARYRDALDVVREAAERPAMDFQLDYRQGCYCCCRTWRRSDTRSSSSGPKQKAVWGLAGPVAASPSKITGQK